MKRRSLLYALPFVLLAGCSIDVAEIGEGPPDEPDSPDARTPAGVAVHGSTADEERCESNKDCDGDEGGPVCYQGVCVPCSPLGNVGCLQGEYCHPQRLRCIPGCDDVADCNGFLCNAKGECSDYVETTPICNYLERGLDDLDGQSDIYSLSPVNVRTLADIDRLAFGLDIPRDRCLDPNHAFPCTDKDIHDDWCINGVKLSALRHTLFSKEANSASGCLFMAHGGLSGVKEISGEELRANEQWGFDAGDLVELFKYVTFDEEGNIGVIPDGLVIPGEQVARLIESTIYMELARYNKGEANASYHDNKRGVTIFPTRKSKVDCDFGGCPDPSARASSPWVEVEEQKGSIAVDIDLEFVNNTYDPGDCIPNPDPNEFGQHCGNLDTSLGYGSLGFTLDVTCEDTTNGKKAIQVAVSEPTFEPEGGILNYAQELCGFVASLFGGSTVGIIGYETWCEDKVEQLDPANIFAQKLGDSFSQNLLQNLDSCPKIVIKGDGTIIFGTEKTIDCNDNDCVSQPARVAPGVTFAYDATSATIATKQLVHLLYDIAPPPPEPLAGKAFSMKQVDQGIVALCALQATCNVKKLNFADLDFELLGKVLETLPEGSPPDTKDLGELIAWLGQDAYDALQAFASQGPIQSYCVDDTTGIPEWDNMFWLLEVWNAMTSEQCSNLPPLEALFPASLIDVEITTVGGNVTDNYPFVDFSDPGPENWKALAGAACRHLYDQAYQPAPPSWQNCPDPENPAYHGQRGCPCADVDIFTIEDILEDGGRPDGAGSYRMHGQSGPGQHCDDDSATIGDEVVCGLSQKHQAECQECGLDTNLGCSCLQDSDCEGIEPNLTCVGDAADGWGPGARGTCLPDISATNTAYEALSEMPWFCLESCDAIAASGRMGCLYDQEENVDLPHARCVNVDAMSYDPQAWTTCAESGMFWEDDNVCGMECTSTDQCADRGYPDHFICDFEYGWSPGNCVPEGCQSMNVADEVFALCQLYR